MPVHGWTPHARHQDELQFLQVFFSVLDNLPEHRGIYRRWEREAQRAQESGEYCFLPNVWPDGAGYVRTLQRVRDEVSRDVFSGPDVLQLDGLAARVVRRREMEYSRAEAKGKADAEHQKALEEWREVKRALEAKKSRLRIEEEGRAQNANENWGVLIIILFLLFLVWMVGERK